MDDLKDLLGSADVPDPGEAYWRSFGKRVEAASPPAAPKPVAKSAPRRFLAVVAGAAALLMGSAAGLWFLPGDETPVAPPPPPASPGGPEALPSGAAADAAGRTAKLAGREDAGVLGILREAASEKVQGAERAFDRRDVEVLAPLARSYAKILREGLRPRLNLAVESGEDLSPWVPEIRRALESGASTWKRLSEKTEDEASRREMAGACEATREMETLLEDEFPLGRD
jgi:hypothetical protein